MKKGSMSRKIFNVFNIAFMCILVALMIFPYLNILAKAFNEGVDTSYGGIVLIPRKFTWENFASVIQDKAFPRATFVSVVRTLCGTLIALIVQFMAAYAFTHKNLYGRRGLLIFLMIPMYFGGGLIPLYIYFSMTGMLNSWALYLLPSAFSIYNMIIIRSYMDTIPESLREAAYIDGATEMQILWKVITPLCKPIMATIALWSAVGHWSDYTTTMYFFTKKSMFTLQYVLYLVLKEHQIIEQMLKEAALRGEDTAGWTSSITPISVQSAQIIITTLPIVLSYPFLQKYFIQGVVLGAVKD